MTRFTNKDRRQLGSVVRQLQRIRGDTPRDEDILRQARDKLGAVLGRHAPPVPPGNDRVPLWPFTCDMLYNGLPGSDNGRPYPGQTLHLPLLKPSEVRRTLDYAQAAGHTHIAICTRSGLDGRHSFKLAGEYDFLRDPEELEPLYEEVTRRGMALIVFLLEDDDRSYNANTARVLKGWKRFLDYWYPRLAISGVYTGIEVNETVGEQGGLSRTKPRTRAMQTERVAWLNGNYPGLPVGMHLTSDALIEVPGVYWYGYQAHATSHDGSLRSPGAFANEFGPNTDNDQPRPGLWAKERGARLALMEVADTSITPEILAGMVAGARDGARVAGNEFSSGVG